MSENSLLMRFLKITSVGSFGWLVEADTRESRNERSIDESPAPLRFRKGSFILIGNRASASTLQNPRYNYLISFYSTLIFNFFFQFN